MRSAVFAPSSAYSSAPHPSQADAPGVVCVVGQAWYRRRTRQCRSVADIGSTVTGRLLTTRRLLYDALRISAPISSMRSFANHGRAEGSSLPPLAAVGRQWRHRIDREDFGEWRWNTRHVLSPSFVDPSLDSRSVTFENPTGERGGQLHHGRKVGRGSTILRETVASRISMGREPSGTSDDVSSRFPKRCASGWRSSTICCGTERVAPCLDLFGMPAGRPVQYSALTSAQESRGFNSYLPMPFANTHMSRSRALRHTDASTARSTTARARTQRHGRVSPCGVPAREPNRAESRFRHRRRTRRSWPIRRLQHWRARARRGHVVRRG